MHRQSDGYRLLCPHAWAGAAPFDNLDVRGQTGDSLKVSAQRKQNDFRIAFGGAVYACDENSFVVTVPDAEVIFQVGERIALIPPVSSGPARLRENSR